MAGEEPRIVFSPHARLRMAQRCIGDRMVREAILDPDVKAPGKVKGRVRVHKEIGGRLGISAHTAKFHVESLLRKLGAVNRAEAVREGIRRGLIGV